MKHKPSAVLVAVVALLAAWPAFAQASFTPRLALAVDPATPHAAPAIEATVISATGDTPARRFTLSFPRGFALRHPSGVETCSTRQRRARRCHAASEIGSVVALTTSGARLRGTVNLAKHGRQREIVALVHGAAGIPDLTFTGYARLGPTGGPQVTLDGLPNLPLTSLTIRLTGGKRGLVRAPASCGAEMVQGLLTSQLGEMAIGLSPVNIAGC
jgi:hypothetical protein